jgi:TRAP-type C4-dicarboxylate transport system substrate-binding protein
MTTRISLAVMLWLPVHVAAAEFTLRVHHFLGEDSLPHTGLIQPWARQVEADSNGRIDVEIYPKMALGGKTPELVDQVRKGTVDIVWTAAAYTPNQFPRAEVFTLPSVHGGDPAATNQAMMSAIDSFLGPDFQGVKPLLAHVQAGHSLHMSRRSIAAVSDLDGLTLRPAGRRIGIWMIDALGAKPSRKRHPKLSAALEQNQLDGALMSFQLARSLDVIESVASHTMRGEKHYFGTSLYLFLMNPASYERLPADLQSVIDRNAGMDLARQAGQTWETAEQDAIAAARQQGNSILVLSEEQQGIVDNAAKAIERRWSDTVEKYGIDGPRLIAQARQAIDRHRPPHPLN